MKLLWTVLFMQFFPRNFIIYAENYFSYEIPLTPNVY